jgi:hypothetical protein
MPLPALASSPSNNDISRTVNRLIREFNRPDTLPTLIGTDTGTATAYAIAPVPGIMQYQVGQEFIFQATHANSGADPTLAVNALSAGVIKGLDGSALAAGDIPADGWATVITTSTTPTFALVGIKSASAVLADILTTRGDLLVRGASTAQRLALGTSGQVLTSNGTDAVWGNQNLLQMVSFETGAVATGTTTIPFDDTIPQSTEGDQYMSLSITPKSATSKLVIEAIASLQASVANSAAIALFQDSGANAVAVSWTRLADAAHNLMVPLRHVMTAGTTSATTFKVRAGGQGATITFNGAGGSRFFGGALASSIVIREYAA